MIHSDRFSPLLNELKWIFDFWLNSIYVTSTTCQKKSPNSIDLSSISFQNEFFFKLNLKWLKSNDSSFEKFTFVSLSVHLLIFAHMFTVCTCVIYEFCLPFSLCLYRFGHKIAIMWHIEYERSQNTIKFLLKVNFFMHFSNYLFCRRLIFKEWATCIGSDIFISFFGHRFYIFDSSAEQFIFQQTRIC